MKEAEKWLAMHGIPTAGIKGQYFDLHDKEVGLPEGVGFRIMVIRAAKRILEKRGAKGWLPD